MNAISNAATSTQRLSGQSWKARLAANLKRWWTAYVTWRAEQAAADQLAAMSDRELSDIGLSRTEIDSAVKSKAACDRRISRYYLSNAKGEGPQGRVMKMTYESMMTFAEAWIAAWNRRDVEAVLAHFSEEAQFVSPVARNLAGRPLLRNKRELEDYWRTALERISLLEFKLDHAAWDEKRRELNVVYESNLNGERKRACEIMQFDELGRQIRGEALYGAIL